jgi:hypothetical protein
VAGCPRGFLAQQVAHLLAHGLAQLSLEDRIGGGERLGQIPQIVRLTELMMTTRQSRGYRRHQTPLLITEHGQNRPLQVPQRSQEGLERGLIELRQPPTAQRQPCG